ncbi:MAG: hypothetical protein M3Z00_08885 [Actinomycetota bacterium]|nr:hypothetical protein [Actinomycetota bacterium]
MTQTEPPQDDRTDDDDRQPTNPQPGGNIDTSGSALPPYDDRSTGSDERQEGVPRAMGSEPPLREPNEPAGADDVDLADAQAPDDVGESVGRRAEDIADREGKEAGRVDTGTDAATDRPTGESTSRDQTSVDPG